MRRAGLPLLALALVGTAGAAREDAPPPNLAGLLTPATNPLGPPGCVGVDPARTLPVHGSPDGPRIGRIRFRPPEPASAACEGTLPRLERGGEDRPLPYWESGYELQALAVLERRGQWLRLHLGETSGWVLPPADAAFEAYPALLSEKLAYATPAWQGELCERPGEACRTLPQRPPEAPMQVHAAAMHAGEAWIEVGLTTDGCRDGEARPLARGWIRAYGEGGFPAAWFHPRGC